MNNLREYVFERPTAILVGLAIFGMVGFLLILLSTARFGVGVSHDSAFYLSGAKSILEGDGYSTPIVPWDHPESTEPIISWPPLFPLIVAVISLTGVEPIIGARFLNALIFGLIAMVAGFYLLRRTGSLLIATVGCVCVLTSFPLVFVSKMAWSEPLFILMITLFCFSMASFSENQKPIYLIAAALLAALSFLTRFIGVTVIATGIIVLLLPGSYPIRQRLKATTIFLVISSALPALWILRNYAIADTFLGERSSSSVGLYHNLKITVGTIANWYIPPQIPLKIQIAFWGIGILPLVAVILFQRYRLKSRFIGMEIWITFIMVYVFFLVVQASLIQFDDIGQRLLAPIVVPGIIVALVILGEFKNSVKGKIQRITPKIRLLMLVGVIGFLVVFPTYRTYGAVTQAYAEGAGWLASDYWNDNDIIDYLRSNNVTGVIYSNRADAVYTLAALNAKWTPSKEERSLDGFRNKLMAQDAYVVWFNQRGKSWQIPLDKLLSSIELAEYRRTQDGVIYRWQSPQEGFSSRQN